MPTIEWVGKDKVINHHQEVPFRVLDYQYTYTIEGPVQDKFKSENMIIHGDNLDALKALLPRFENKVKCIYIDPPYNTGNENWVYNDNVNDPKINKWLGDIVGKEGEDLTRHDKWLCMMYPRLKLLQKLLSDDGAIFISIDDNEQANLKFICDEIFGSSNFVANIIWQKRTSPDSRKKISNGHEYVLIYVKNKDLLDQAFNLLLLDEKDAAKFKNPDNDPRGPWVSTDFTAQGFRPNQMYSIITPGGVAVSPPEGRCWKNIEDVYSKYKDEGRLWFGSDGCGVPRQKTYLSERKGKNTWTWWTNQEVGHTQEATQELASLLGAKAIFDYPKPVRLIERIIQLATFQDSIVLDSFAGSATTAHAVLNSNIRDGGNRKFILVEMEDYAETITAERVRKVIDKMNSNMPIANFNYYTLGKTLFNECECLNETVPKELIEEYVFYMETKTSYGMNKSNNINPYYLGSHNQADYYFLYEKDRQTVLNHAFLSTITKKAERYIIYADKNILSEAEMEKCNITFKKIPRDIARL